RGATRGLNVPSVINENDEQGNPVNGQTDEVAKVRRTRVDGHSGAVHVLGRGASFWVAAAVVVHTLWTSAAPSMTYPLYASEWGLTHTATAAIFAVFPIVVVAVLTFSGDLSDY